MTKNDGIARLRATSKAISPFRLRSGATVPVPPSMLLLFDMFAVQLGAALAIHLFSELGPGGMVFLRVALAALMLVAFWRPWRRSLQGAEAGRLGVLAGARRADYVAVVAFGLVLALMNFAFYSALTRIPLGIAVTVEFVGPLGVAIIGSRRALDLVWVVLAVGGILLLAPLGTLGASRLDPLGLLLALGAGACWATYILLSARVGRAFPGGTGLSLAMAVGAVFLLPVGIAGAGRALLDPHLLLLASGVALLSSVVPYSLEIAALRRMSPGAFGIFMSLEPAIAALVGWVVLREALDARAIVALVLVTAAAVGAARSGVHAD